MDYFQEESELLQITQDQYQSLTNELRKTESSLAEVTRIRDQLQKDKHLLAMETTDFLRDLKDKLANKILAVKQIQQYFHRVLEQQQKDRCFVPNQLTLYSQEQLDRLSFTIEGALKFDTLSMKRQNLAKEGERKTSALREDIKTLKLKLSLCEMEYKEFLNSIGRRGSDRTEN